LDGESGSVFVFFYGVWCERVINHFYYLGLEKKKTKPKFFLLHSGSRYPDGLSDCDRYKGNQTLSGCKTMKYTPAFDPLSCGYSVFDGNGEWVQGMYTRTHRDVAIVNAMRKWMGLSGPLSYKELGLSSKCV
jgi:hypothetical protein